MATAREWARLALALKDGSVPRKSRHFFFLCASAQTARKGQSIILLYPPVLFLPEVDWRVEALGSCSCPRACFFVSECGKAVASRIGVDQRDQRKDWIDHAQRNRAGQERGYASLVDFDIGFGKAAANVDRTAQSHGTGVLSFLFERQIQLLLSQIDAA
jgi:hypothetical protein